MIEHKLNEQYYKYLGQLPIQYSKLMRNKWLLNSSVYRPNVTMTVYGYNASHFDISIWQSSNNKNHQGNILSIWYSFNY